MLTNLILFFSGVVVGMVVWAFIKKQKVNRRFDIENQMLRDQAEILRLQKRVSDIEAEKRQLVSYVESSKQKTSSLQNIAS
ncbi:MAG: hypothetical protein DI598_13660 [Pseudopedobacter saltans]|uniref:Uncharacterized protein n=1 Tax=Pseudopedobacter saltans TaxID=151895 RepID=A0A2W5EV83_9SPHI|nr:MAG: hypothetical protein DI598_13660 [Pseudopedobacter saltans]